MGAQLFLGILCVVCGFLYLLRKKKLKNHERHLLKLAKLPQGKILLHQMNRAKYCANPSPFCLKLETFLRWHKIPYKIDNDDVFGPERGLTPWVSFMDDKGQIVTLEDSQNIMDHLRLRHNIDEDFGDEQTILANLWRLRLENHFGPILASERWIFTSKLDLVEQFVAYKSSKWIVVAVLKILGLKKKFQLTQQGIARRPREEQISLGKTDLRELSYFLGQKSFFFGEFATSLDCVSFAFLAQVLYTPSNESELGNFVKENCPNLVRHTNSIREKFWPDWKDICQVKD